MAGENLNSGAANPVEGWGHAEPGSADVSSTSASEATPNNAEILTHDTAGASELKPDNVETAPDEAAPAEAEKTGEALISEEFKKALGGEALVLTQLDQTEQRNTIVEAVEKKLQRGGALVNNVFLRPFFASKYARQAKKALKKSGGDLSAVYAGLKLETGPIESSSDNLAAARARLAIEADGFSKSELNSDNSMALVAGEKVEKADSVVEKRVSNGLKDLYNNIKEAAGDAEKITKAKEAYAEQVNSWQKDGLFNDQTKKNPIAKYLAGKELMNVDALKKAGDAVEKLVDHTEGAEQVTKFLEGKIYNAHVKEGVYTKESAKSGLVEAAVYAGTVGAISYAIFANKGRMKARAQVGAKVAQELAGTTTTGVLKAAAQGAATGGVIGAAAGLIRGAVRAKGAVSQANVKAATSAEAIETAEDRAAAAAEAAKAATEAAQTEASEGAEAAEGASEGIAENVAESEGGLEAPQIPEMTPDNKKKYGKIKRAIEGFTKAKRKFTGEDKYNDVEYNNELWGRKSAKEIYDKLDQNIILAEIMGEGGADKMKALVEKDPKGLKAALDSMMNNEKMKNPLENPTEELMEAMNSKEYKQIRKILRGLNKAEAKKHGKEISEEMDAQMTMTLAAMLKNGENLQSVKGELADTIAEVQARNEVSADQKIDLIAYSKGNVARERMLIAEKMIEAGKIIEGAEIEGTKQAKMEALMEKIKSTKLERGSYIVRGAMADAIIGGTIGAVAGGIFGGVRELKAGLVAEKANSLTETDTPEAEGVSANSVESTGETVNASNVEFRDDDGNGAYEVYVNGEQMTGEQGTIEVRFDDQGKMDAESLKALSEQFGEIKETSEVLTLQGGRGTMEAKDFFNVTKYAEKFGDRVDGNGEPLPGYKIEDVKITSWAAAGNGNRAIDMGGFERQNDGEFVSHIVARDESINLGEGVQVVLKAGGETGNMGIALDVNPDGSVVVPAGSPAASFFDGDGNFIGRSMEVVRAGDGDGFEALGTVMNRSGLVTDVSFDDVVQKTTYSYTLADGSALAVPGDAVVDVDYAMVGAESLRNSGLVEYNYAAPEVEFSPSGELIGEAPAFDPDGGHMGIMINAADSSDKMEMLMMPERSGGYSEMLDPFFSANKEGNALLGQNLVRELVDPDYEMTDVEANAAFEQAVESGALKTETIMNRILEAKGNSPEGITTLRTLMGNFNFDIDGDGTEELIDTQAEIDAVSEILKNSAETDAYSNFVNDTYAMLFDKLRNGEISLVNYGNHPYSYTSLGWRDAENIVHRLFSPKRSECSGWGLRLTGSDGGSIYDEDIVRRVYQLPSNAKITDMSWRLNCGDDAQDTVTVEWIRRAVKETTTQQVETIETIKQEVIPVNQPGQPTGGQPTGGHPTGGGGTPPSSPSNPVNPPSNPVTPVNPEPEQPLAGKTNYLNGNNEYQEQLANTERPTDVTVNDNFDANPNAQPGNVVVETNEGMTSAPENQVGLTETQVETAPDLSNPATREATPVISDSSERQSIYESISNEGSQHNGSAITDTGSNGSGEVSGGGSDGGSVSGGDSGGGGSDTGGGGGSDTGGGGGGDTGGGGGSDNGGGGDTGGGGSSESTE